MTTADRALRLARAAALARLMRESRNATPIRDPIRDTTLV